MVTSEQPPSLLRSEAAAYQAPLLGHSLWQAASTFALFVATCALMYASLGLPYWATLLLAVPAAGFVVRIFIIQHDCGHGSYFRSRAANDAMGWLCSVVTLTPYANWRRQHAGHHAHWNNLDRRLSGVDIYSSCLTTEEYGALSRKGRLTYRITRHPAVLLLLMPPIIFLFLYRVVFDTPKSWRTERRSVHLTNLVLLATILPLGFLLGFVDVLKVQLPVIMLAAVFGVWLFSIQHRFEQVQWMRQKNWTFVSASLQGSSYLRLPRLLQWFTGNIGFHHVHHLSPRVPNYRLEACHRASAGLRAVPVLTLLRALGSSRCALWDETASRMVPFRGAGRAQAASLP